MEKPFKQMTNSELKQYLSANRTDDDKFSAALAELISRDPNPTIYPFEQSPEEVSSIIKQKIEEIEREK